MTRRSLPVPVLLTCLLTLTACSSRTDGAGAAPSAAATPPAVSPPAAAPSPAAASPSFAPSAPGSASASAPGAPPSPVVAKAEVVCKDANAELAALPRPTTVQEAGTGFASGVAVLDRSITRLEQLSTGSAQEQRFQTLLLTPLRGQADAVRTFLDEFRVAVVKGPQAVSALKPPTLPKADLPALRELGLQECATLANQ